MNFILVYWEKVKNFLFYDKHYFISLVFLIILTFVFYSRFSEKQKQRIFFFLFIFLLIFFALWSFNLSLAQYFIWKNHPIFNLLVKNKSYFLRYVYFHFWRDWFYRLLGFFVIVLLMRLINFGLRRDVFYDEEKILVPFLSMFFFFPYNILFLVLGFFMLLLITGVKIIKEKKAISERFSFKQYWIILAWIVFLLAPLLFSHIELLKYKP